jgi:hypothetical protein
MFTNPTTYPALVSTHHEGSLQQRRDTYTVPELPGHSTGSIRRNPQRDNMVRHLIHQQLSHLSTDFGRSFHWAF